MRINRKKIRIAMVTHDFTQKTLAKNAGLSRSTINGVCSGRSCSDDTGYKIAKALGVDVTDIIEG